GTVALRTDFVAGLAVPEVAAVVVAAVVGPKAVGNQMIVGCQMTTGKHHNDVVVAVMPDLVKRGQAVSSQSVESVQAVQTLGVERRLAHQRLARQTTTMSVARLVPNRFVRRRRRSPLWAVRCRKTADWRHQRLVAGGSNRPIRD